MKTIYEEFGEYFKNKFINNKNLNFSCVEGTEDMYALYISSGLDFDPYFIRIDKEMIYIDGPVVQDEAMEYGDIFKVKEEKIKAFLDKQAEILQTFLNNGLFFFAYKDGDVVMAISMPTTNRKTFLKKFDAKKVYKASKYEDAPNYTQLEKIELKDFYGNSIDWCGECKTQEKE